MTDLEAPPRRRAARIGRALLVALAAVSIVAQSAVLAGAGLPAERVLHLRGDVCRAELLVEIEGVFAPLD